LQKLSGIHKLDKASKVYKGIATADVEAMVEVRNFKKIRFSHRQPNVMVAGRQPA
jgi:hypothetical protein